MRAAPAHASRGSRTRRGLIAPASARLLVDHLPAFLSLRERTVLVVGAGSVAARKVELLLAAAANVRVVGPVLHADLERLAARERITVVRREFAEADLEDVALVVVATNSRDLNASVARLARARNLWVNVVDDAQESSFIVPAIVDRAPITVAISTGGASPVLARRVRAAIEAVLPERIGELARLAGRWRARVSAALRTTHARRAFWERFFAGPQAARIVAGQDADPDATLGEAIRNAAEHGHRGIVYLIGAGPGDPELLTLRAARLLSEADVVLYDRLVSPEVLARARRDAERVFVGKEAGHHHATQERINELLVEYASRGLRVARLKGGDPFIFGRGGEELDALRERGIEVIVVPGITAGLGAAAQSAIPLTYRRVAEAVTFVTAAGEAGESLDWHHLASPRQTVVFYMGVGQIERITASLIAAGAPASRPVAVIERATLKDERIVAGTLATIASRVRQLGVKPPALLIVGDVVAHAAAAELRDLTRRVA